MPHFAVPHQPHALSKYRCDATVLMTKELGDRLIYSHNKALGVIIKGRRQYGVRCAPPLAISSSC